MKEEKRISYQAGITRKPSDFLCQEGELAECINMTSDGEELKVLTPLSIKNAADKKLLFVHKLPGGGENYIYEEIDDHDNCWLYVNDSQVVLAGGFHETELSPKNVTAIGKTLIVNMGGEIKYFLWNGTGYKSLGKIKEPDTMQFIVANDGEISETAPYSSDQYNGADYVSVVKQEEYDNLALGLYGKLVKKATENKRFVKPFVVRYAVEMYDGSYTCISNPIICYAGVRCNARAVRNANDGKAVSTSMYLRTFQLRFLAKYDYTDYQDIVKDVVVFMSEGVNLYNLAVSQTPLEKWHNASAGNYADEVSGNVYSSYSWINALPRSAAHFQPLTPAGEKAIEDGLKGARNFYKIAELGLKQETNEYTGIDEYIDNNILTNLTSQERLTQDYFTHSVISSDEMLTYNNRLLLTNAKRSFFSGFKFFSAWGAGNTSAYKIYVYIKTDSGDRVVCSGEWQTMQNIGHYIYYPDPRAYKAVIFKNGSYYGTVELKEHPGLNGAYYYSGLPRNYSAGTSFAPPAEDPAPSTEPSISNAPETLTGRIYVSEVNNPFTFTSRGDITVGNGKILGAAALTQALSQGQFGQYPLIAFCSDGIWALSVNSEGVFTSVTPMSREVALESNPCITQTDGAIFFVSKKGLMVVAGSDVQCVSEQMNGPVCNTGDMAGLAEIQLAAGAESRQWAALINSVSGTATFRDFIESASLHIAYDYTDSRLLLVRSDRSWCWVYNIKDGSFSKMTLPGAVISVVNNYPDYLLQTSDAAKTLYSLYDDVQEEACADRVLGFLLTRPMKLAGPLAVSSLRELKHVGWWSEKYGSCVKTLVLASDNLFDWYVVKSRFGMAAKYWRMALFVRMQPRERLSGTIIRKEDRRTENLR